MRRFEELRHEDERDVIWFRAFDDEGHAPEVEFSVDGLTWHRKDFVAMNRAADEAYAAAYPGYRFDDVGRLVATTTTAVLKAADRQAPRLISTSGS